MSPPPTLQPEAWQAILAARLASPKPDFLYSCDNCHEEVPWKRCKSNEKGSEGRWMAMVSFHLCVAMCLADLGIV